MAKSKKELDKDLMFSKIMPALEGNPFSTVSPVPGKAADAPGDAISALRDKIFARSSDFSESDSLATINVMENLVLRNVDTVMQRFNVCGCDRCRCDICACALNQLPAKYIVAKKEKLLKAESEIDQKTVMGALIKAVIQVRSHPRH